MRISYAFFSIIIFIALNSCHKNKVVQPVDFNGFWSNSIIELNKIPLEFEKTRRDTIIENKKISLFKIKSFENNYFYAWVSEPLADGIYPIKIRYSGLGEKNIENNKIKHLWFLKQTNFINMLVDVRGQGLSIDKINPKDYIIEGIKDKETFIYRGAYLDAVRSVDFISKNKKSNGQIIVIGGSQGGAFSIVASALNKKVTICIASFPFLTNIKNYDKNNWPMKIWIHEAKLKDISYLELNKTLSYFDILNFSDKIKVPIFLRTEEFDDITPPKGTIRFYNLLKNQKKLLYIEPCKGHGCSSNSSIANEMEKTFILNLLSE